MAHTFSCTRAGMCLLVLATASAVITASASAQAPVYISQWGTFGSGDGQFRTPQGVAVGGSGKVYVVDGDNNRVSVFNAAGEFLTKWSTPADPIYGPARSIAVDNADNVYVADWYARLIYRFTDTGALVVQWGAFGSLATDGQGRVYVADASANRIQVFNGDGTLVRAWVTRDLGSGDVLGPDGVAVDALGNVYVADPGSSLVQKYTEQGAYVTQWPVNGGPVRLAVGPGAILYAVENGVSMVEALTTDGAPISQWGGPGAAAGQFDNPIGIAVAADGTIYVADVNNSRIQKFGYLSTPAKRTTWGSLKRLYR